MTPSLPDLRAFVTISKLGSFAAAAKALHLSHSALSRRIAGLEDQLGVRLLDRTTRSVALTALGQRFLTDVGQLLDGLDRSVVSLHDVAHLEAGDVTIGCIFSVVHHFLLEVIGEFQQQHPRVMVKLVEESGDAVLSSVKSGHADFAISYTGPAGSWKAIGGEGAGEVAAIGPEVVDHLRAERLAQLQASHPDARRHGVDQEPLALPQAPLQHQHVEGHQEGQRNARGFFLRHAGRHGHGLGLVDQGVFGKGAAAAAHHPVAGAEAGHTDQEKVVHDHYQAKLAVMNIGDGFTTGPAEAAYVINELVRPTAVIPSHANEAGTVGGKVRPGSKTEAFLKASRVPAYIPLSGRTMTFDAAGRCTAGC